MRRRSVEVWRSGGRTEGGMEGRKRCRFIHVKAARKSRRLWLVVVSCGVGAAGGWGDEKEETICKF